MALTRLERQVHAVRGPHHRDLAPDAVESDGAVRSQDFEHERLYPGTTQDDY